jgi:hypothetical protein
MNTPTHPGTLDFTMLKDGMVGKDGSISSKLRVRVFTVDFDIDMGSPEETEEMRPEWFVCGGIPLENMWLDDRFWLPQILRDSNVKMKGGFVFANEGDIQDYDLNFLTMS